MFNAGQYVTDTICRFDCCLVQKFFLDFRERKLFKTLKHIQIVNLFDKGTVYLIDLPNHDIG